MSYWEHPKPVRRSRAVDVDEVAAAAADLLDEGGLRALTVRAVAGKIGVAPASLYSRVESVDDLFDLALNHALSRDDAVNRAVADAELLDLMLAYYRHLVRHPWAGQIIGMRAPRGPSYLVLSERMVVLLAEAGARDPLGAAYILSNFVIGSALTSAMADDERAAPVDPELAPEYARWQKTHPVDPEAIVTVGLIALQNQTIDYQ
ncbi:Transcriptional regulator, TetR family [Corynebacterium atrinae]|uniref:TetR/AcrR family transcriptional regulator n=1 Tax=Corynebacterium atrinae TaxID=1336740 RepID=UPI0025B2C758|nr:TetR family transcriptional regulator [Corynebacterium atrinae]WJY62162.1 Transcriptional regulator, TetR family [Corynebacterium atrinae]